ncbi:MAG TPA: FAD-dependent oxidoreductase [Jiangellaceae bacterium]|nr:FAD-dependent oxidoreductase [Jiangellaceae bacterium]
MTTFSFDGRPIAFQPGQSVGAALVADGVRSWRITRRDGRPRGIFCGIGACFDCLVTVDGRLNQRACLVAAQDGQHVRAQEGTVAMADLVGGSAGNDARAGAEVDVAVVGAGPAGLAAAAAAVVAGCTVAGVDSGRDLGGQYWRHSPDRPAAVPRPATFRRLAATVRSGAIHLPEHEVWMVEPGGAGFVVRTLHHSAERTVRAAAVVLATGAVDRQLPFPGWDLPGVYTAGGAQALLKEHSVLAGRRVVVAGTGPFLLPVAAGLATHGTRIAGVFEAAATTGWLRHAAVLAGHPARLGEAAAYRTRLLASGSRYRTRHAVVAAHGDDRLEAVTVARLDPRWRVDDRSARWVPCDALAVGWGFSPRVELAAGLGCVTGIGADGSVVVTVDDDQGTSVPGVYVAGEACGIGGAMLAVAEGEIAGRAVAARLGRPSPGAGGAHRARSRGRAFAAAMHAVYPVRDGWYRWLRPDTLVCRCEEVPVRDVVTAVRDLGATDTRAAKLLSRAGMGWCQGRICGFALSRIAAAEGGGSGGETGLVRRPLAVPVPLGALARSPEPGSPTRGEESR